MILEGAAKDWPACKEWNLEYFKQKHGDDNIIMADQKDITNDPIETTLGKVIDDIRKGDWVPRSVHKNARSIAKAIADIEQRTGQPATDYEIAGTRYKGK